MNARTATIVMATLALLCAAASLLLYDQLPALLPVHWNWRGEPDGWWIKERAAFMIPAFIAGLTLLMHVIPLLSPRPFSVKAFEPTYCYVFAVIAGLFTFIHSVMLLVGLHPDRDYSRYLTVGLCVSMALLGNVMGKVRRNRFMGIRTPWTLANDAVWIPIHRLAGRLMVAAGLIAAVLISLGVNPVVFLWLLGIAFVIPIIESYRLYHQLDLE